MRSRTIIFTKQQKAELIDQEIRSPKSDEILVRTTISLISTGTESFCFRGVFDPNTTWSNWVKYPLYPGYSAVGKVVEIGENVKNLSVGDRVHTTRSHAEYAVVRADSAIKLPDQVSDATATWSTLATTTQTAIRRAEHKMGDIVVVIGLGGLGQLITQYLRIIGAWKILAIDTIRRRLEISQKFGATAIFEGIASDAKNFVADHTDGNLADVVYDVTGNWRVLPTALPLARNFGKVILLGDSPEPSKQHLTQDVLARQVAVIGTHSAKLPPEYAHWTSKRQIQLFHDYVCRGLFSGDELISHRFKPDQASEVYTMLLEDRSETLGVLFDWEN